VTSLLEDIHIHAPAETVFARLSDIESYASWLPSHFRELRATDGTLSFALAFPLVRRRSRLVLTEATQHSYVELRPAPGTERDAKAFEGIAWGLDREGTRNVHLTAEATYALPRGPLGPLLDLLLLRNPRRQALRDALWRLKQHVEADTG
jgi:uncharacterized membrane protein